MHPAYFDIHSQPVPEKFSNKIYQKLSSVFRRLLPMERHVVLSMKDYDIKPIKQSNPEFDRFSPFYHRIIIFCVKTMRDDLYQPIASIVIPKEQHFREETYYLLGEAIKMYIFTIHKMGLIVVATVSPPSSMFKKIFQRIANIKSLDKLHGPIIYNVYPFAPMAHIFDYTVLVAEIINNFKKHKIIWKENQQKHQTDWLQIWNTVKNNKNSFKEIKLTSESHSTNEDHIFKDHHLQALEKFCRSPKSTKASISNFRFIEIFTNFLRFLDMDVILYPLLKQSYENWMVHLDIIETMTLRNVITANDSSNYDKDLEPFKDWIVTIKGIHWLSEMLNSRHSDFLFVSCLRQDYFNEFVNHHVTTKGGADVSNVTHDDLQVFNVEMGMLALDNSPDAGGCLTIVV